MFSVAEGDEQFVAPRQGADLILRADLGFRSQNLASPQALIFVAVSDKISTNAMKSILLGLVIWLQFLVVAADGQPSNSRDKQVLAQQVKTEFLHAWNGYKKYCWGHDDL